MQHQPHDRSPLALLIGASVLVWTIVIDRSVRLSKLRRQVSLLSEVARDPSRDPGPGVAIEIMKAGQAASNERRREPCDSPSSVTALSTPSPWFAPAGRTAVTRPRWRCFVTPAFRPSQPQ
jgi:hypothetical protein